MREFDKPVTSKLEHNKVSTSKVKKKNISNITSYIDSSACGYLEPVTLRMQMRKSLVEYLRPSAQRKVFNSPTNAEDKVEHMCDMYATHSDQNSLVCLWSIKNMLAQKIQTVKLQSVDRNEKGVMEIDLKAVGAVIPKTFNKITSMCSAPLHTKGQMCEHILYTTMAVISNNPSMALLRNLNCSSSDDFR